MESDNNNCAWTPIADELLSQGYEISGCQSVTAQSVLLTGRQTLLERDVAIKILNSCLSESDKAYERFQREAKLLGSFDHPNIVRLYGIGRLKDGRPYMVMELLRGVSLNRLIETSAGTLPERQILAYCAQICDALAYAHGKNIVHRDLKPANIMVQSDDSREIVKLIDFGIHKNTEAISQNLTAAGSVAPGTANYMSPEQCRGEPVDARSDIYSLGCLLYELCTGKAPMDAESDWLIMSNHANKKISELPFARSVSANLKSVISRCLEKNPERRWSSAEAMKGALKTRDPSAGRSIKLGLAALTLIFLPMFIPGLLEKIRTMVHVGEQSHAKDNIELSWPWERFVLLKSTLSAKEWQRKCRQWFKQHLRDFPNVRGLVACLEELDSESQRELSSLLTSFHSNVREYNFKHVSKNPIFYSTLVLQLDLEIATRSWTEAEATLGQIAEWSDSSEDLTRVRRPCQLLKGAYATCGMYAEYLKLFEKYFEKYFNAPAESNTLDEKVDLLCWAAYASETMKQPDRANRYLSRAVDEYLKSDHAGQYATLDVLCIRLRGAGQSQQIIKIAQHFPPRSEVLDQAEALTYLHYAQAFIDLGQTKEADKILEQLSSRLKSPAFLEKLFMVQDLQLRNALVKNDKKLILQRVDTVLRQFRDGTANPDYGALLQSWEADPKLAKYCFVRLEEQEIRRPLDLANLLMSYAHYLRESEKSVASRIPESLSCYQLAQKFFDRDGRFFQGRINAFVGEALCHMALGDMAASEACIIRGKEYMKTGSVEPGLASELPDLEGNIFRSRGKYEAAVALHKGIIEALLDKRKIYPVYFGKAVCDLALDYQAAGQKRPGLEAIKKYMPLLESNQTDRSLLDAVQMIKRQLSE